MGRRLDGRSPQQMRAITIARRYLQHAEGSALIELGNTRVLCAATVEENVPPFLRGSQRGWVTAEYAMLPRATADRSSRKVRGRDQEIRRLIGRSLRAVTDMEQLGERTIILDCDVIQADGGTRGAAITGAFVALCDAVGWLQNRNLVGEKVIGDFMAAVSVGLVSGQPVLDLCYEEDFLAEVDMNVVMTESGKLVEIQGAAEGALFSQSQMLKLISLARDGIRHLVKAQKRAMRVGGESS